MNILTYDTEEWYLEKTLHGGRKEKYAEFDRYLHQILDKLDERCVKGTFFCLGALVPEFDYVIKEIHKRGHEIGCHSYKHTWLNRLSREEAFMDTKHAVDALEQCIGSKVRSYRAPAFSIGQRNKWAFEILAECGIEIDASVYPAARDFGGFANFGSKTPCTIDMDGIKIKEFPICTTKVLGKELAYSGGGYFRFFPLGFVESEMKKADYSMTYFHIGDLVPDSVGVKTKEEYESYYKEPGTLKNRYLRYIKTNLGKKGAFNKMLNLIENLEFVNIQQVDSTYDWDNAPHIIL